MTMDETEGMRIWRDDDGKLWTLADSGIDTEMFELIGEPIYNEVSRSWCQEIQLRIGNTSNLSGPAPTGDDKSLRKAMRVD